jgi:hypothetical protein
MRESIVAGDPTTQEALGVLESTGSAILGESPSAAIASIQRYALLGEREAMILAFNEITTVVAICLALSLLFLPLVKKVRHG